VSRELPVARIDVFTSRPFAGNPAAAVLDADGLSPAEMQAIAGELRAPGTSFVSLPPPGPGADHGLRKFTPTREVAYSGHTTLGAATALSDAGRAPGGRIVFRTTQGLLPVSIEETPDGRVLWLEPPVPACRPFDAPVSDVVSALGLDASRLARWAPAAVTPDTDLLLPMPDLATLHRLAPDLPRLAALGTAHGLRAFCLVSLETVDAASSSHARFFAPQFGIPEDVVTGSVHSALGVWLYEAGRVTATSDGVAAFTAEQGDILGRPGRLHVALRAEAGRVRGVRVGGRTVTVLTGRLRLP
jgi:PhzF family phenazine biosynthesis protein